MRIGIVNDLSLAREALRRVVASAPGHQVAWTAGDGAEAVDRAMADRPDLILMDLIMPGVDGAEATRRIMAQAPCAILVVTATVSGHMNKVYEAMGHGALDAVDTPTLLGAGDGGRSLLQKIETIGRLVGRAAPTASSGVAGPTREQGPKAWHPLVLIGSSTGGPSALAEVLSRFPPGWPAATVIAQHVDAAFAPGLASWLAERTGRPVGVITPGVAPEPGSVLIAGTNDHAAMRPDGRLHYVAEPAELSYRPSVDVLFATAGRHWPGPGVAVLLTGMGRDGAVGMLDLRRRGWRTIAQDEPTCVVPGMPRAAAELGAAELILPLDRIGDAVVARVRELAEPHPTRGNRP